MADIYFEGDAGGEEPVKERWCAFDGVEETQSQRPHLKRMRPLLSFMRFSCVAAAESWCLHLTRWIEGLERASSGHGWVECAPVPVAALWS